MHFPIDFRKIKKIKVYYHTFCQSRSYLQINKTFVTLETLTISIVQLQIQLTEVKSLHQAITDYGHSITISTISPPNL